MTLTDAVMKVVSEAGRPLSASEVEAALKENNDGDLSQYIDSRSSSTAAIQKALESLASMPGARVRRMDMLGRQSKFEWIHQSSPAR